jgi:hypothetical protein
MVKMFLPSLVWTYVLVALAVAGAFWLSRRGAKRVAVAILFITSGACFLIVDTLEPTSLQATPLYVITGVVFCWAIQEFREHRQAKPHDHCPAVVSDRSALSEIPSFDTLGCRDESKRKELSGELEIRSGSFAVTLVNDPTYPYRPDDKAKNRTRGREYSFCGDDRPTSIYAISSQGPGGESYSCVLLGDGGATTVHSNSAVIVGDRCFVAIGYTLCALAVPSLQLSWAKTIDTATCFGVYHCPEHDCLISHGEMEIVRVSLAGDVVWTTVGHDIFTGDFRLAGKIVEATDFNNHVYHVDIETGRILRVTQKNA